MQTIELSVKECLQLENEIQDILKRKAQIKFKFHLTEIGLKLKPKVDVAKEELNKLFAEHGVLNPNTGLSEIPIYADENKTELTQAGKEYIDINNSIIELEYEPININSFESIESEMNYSILFKLIQS